MAIDRKAEGEYIRGLWRADEDAKLRRIADAERIVRQLAANDPVVEQMTDYDASELVCHHCGVTEPAPHADGCVFWAAVEWVEAHPEGASE